MPLEDHASQVDSRVRNRLHTILRLPSFQHSRMGNTRLFLCSIFGSRQPTLSPGWWWALTGPPASFGWSFQPEPPGVCSFILFSIGLRDQRHHSYRVAWHSMQTEKSRGHDRTPHNNCSRTAEKGGLWSRPDTEMRHSGTRRLLSQPRLDLSKNNEDLAVEITVLTLNKVGSLCIPRTITAKRT